MNEQIPRTKLRIVDPARYEIWVQGALDERWSGRLSGLSIKTLDQGDGSPVTRLSGDVLDQAALLGVLNALYQLQLSLISVVYMEVDAAEELS